MSWTVGRSLALALVLAGCSSVASSPIVSAPMASVATAPSMETSLEPSASATVTALPAPTPMLPARTPAATHVVTRIRITALRIDLPVIASDPAVYTPCGVALYLSEFRQPGQRGAVYIYAQPRKGLFLPILDAVIAGRQLIGLTVELFTSDAFHYRYTIQEVRRHQRDLKGAYSASTDQLWLQTGEGATGSDEIQLVALPDGSPTAVTEREAHPTPYPVACP